MLYTEKFHRTIFGYFRQSDVQALDVGARSSAVQSKLRSNSWIDDESTPREIDTIDQLIAEHGIDEAESLVRNAAGKSDSLFSDDVAVAEHSSEPTDAADSSQAAGRNSQVKTEASPESDQAAASELGQAIRDDLGKLGQTVQAAVGEGIVWGVGLLILKVIYGVNQSVGPIESIFSPNGLIVFGIGFVFGTFHGFTKD